MPRRRPPIPGPDARHVEHLLGLAPWSLLDIERRVNGDFALRIRGQLVAGRYRWVLRIPRRRIIGYQHLQPTRPRIARYRQRENARRTAWWLWDLVGGDAPIITRASLSGQNDEPDRSR